MSSIENKNNAQISVTLSNGETYEFNNYYDAVSFLTFKINENPNDTYAIKSLTEVYIQIDEEIQKQKELDHTEERHRRSVAAANYARMRSIQNHSKTTYLAACANYASTALYSLCCDYILNDSFEMLNNITANFSFDLLSELAAYCFAKARLEKDSEKSAKLYNAAAKYSDNNIERIRQYMRQKIGIDELKAESINEIPEDMLPIFRIYSKDMSTLNAVKKIISLQKSGSPLNKAAGTCKTK